MSVSLVLREETMWMLAEKRCLSEYEEKVIVRLMLVIENIWLWVKAMSDRAVLVVQTGDGWKERENKISEEIEVEIEFRRRKKRKRTA